MLGGKINFKKMFTDMGIGKGNKTGHLRNKSEEKTVDPFETQTEQFVSTGGEGTSELKTHEFKLPDKFKEQMQASNIQSDEIKGDSPEIVSPQMNALDEGVRTDKPANLSKLEGLEGKYGKISKQISDAMMSGMLPGIGLALGGVAGGLPTIMGAVLGGIAGSALTGDSHGETTTMTDSGIKRHNKTDIVGGMLGNSHIIDDFTLPDGTKIHKESHSSGLQGSRDKSLEAFDAEGNKLKADFVETKKGLGGIKVNNPDGTIATLDLSNMDLTIETKADKTEKHTPKVAHKSHPLIPDCNPLGYMTETQGDAKYVTESQGKKQVIHEDGSMEIILDEKSQYYKQQVKDPVHEGETSEKVSPKHHSFTKVSVSADGSTNVERVDENYRTTVDYPSGEITTKRQKIGDKFAGLFRRKLATSMDTDGNLLVGKKKNPIKDKKHIEIEPFITRGEIKDAKSNFVEAQKKDFPNLIETKGVDGSTYLADSETGKLRVLKPDGNQKWISDMTFEEGIAAPPVVDGENIFVLDKGNELHCVKNGFGGYEKWGAEIDGKIIGDPSVDKDGNVRVFVEKAGHKVERLINGKTGTIKSQIVHPKESMM